jgi:transcriptional regulator with XRE-family HTH domain
MARAELLRIIGANVRSLRVAKKLSQERLAELSDLHRTFVGGVERGERNVTVLTLAFIARALDVLPTDLLRGVGREVIAAMPATHRAPRSSLREK